MVGKRKNNAGNGEERSEGSGDDDEYSIGRFSPEFRGQHELDTDSSLSDIFFWSFDWILRYFSTFVHYGFQL